MWRPPRHEEDEVRAFRAGCRAARIRPVVLHSIYLANLASADTALREKSIASLIDSLTWADRLGAEAVITHLGSATGDSRDAALDRLADSVAAVLAGHRGRAILLLETCAGQGFTLGCRFEDIGEIIRRLAEPPKLGAAFDSAHVLAAGYDLVTPRGLAETLSLFDRHVGLRRLRAVHLNDSKAARGSNVDRHANLGEGHLGLPALRRLLRHPDLRGRPVLLEVPGYAGAGPDAPSMATLYRLAGRRWPHTVGTSAAAPAREARVTADGP